MTVYILQQPRSAPRLDAETCRVLADLAPLLRQALVLRLQLAALLLAYLLAALAVAAGLLTLFGRF